MDALIKDITSSLLDPIKGWGNLLCFLYASDLNWWYSFSDIVLFLRYSAKASSVSANSILANTLVEKNLGFMGSSISSTKSFPIRSLSSTKEGSTKVLVL